MTITQEQLQEARITALTVIKTATQRKDRARTALNEGARSLAPTTTAAGQHAQTIRQEEYRDAYTDWRSTLITEHARQLLRPLEIYRAAGITKQMFAKLRAQSARDNAQQTQQPATATRAALPPDDLPTTAVMPEVNTTSTSAAYGPAFTQ